MLNNQGLDMFAAFIPILFFLGFAAFGIGMFAFWIWMLVDCIQNETNEGNSRLIWVLVIIFTSWVGALLYFFIQRSKRIRELKENE